MSAPQTPGLTAWQRELVQSWNAAPEGLVDVVVEETSLYVWRDPSGGHYIAEDSYGSFDEPISRQVVSVYSFIYADREPRVRVASGPIIPIGEVA